MPYHAKILCRITFYAFYLHSIAKLMIFVGLCQKWHDGFLLGDHLQCLRRTIMKCRFQNDVIRCESGKSYMR